MKSIWKYPLALNDFTVMDIPRGFRPLSVQMQAGEPQLWCLVDPNAITERVTVRMFGTGDPVPDDPGTFVSTLQLAGHRLVFHVFISPNGKEVKS